MTLDATALPVKNILLDLEVLDKNQLLEYASALLEDSVPQGKSKILKSLIDRENMGSTALGRGVAVPHGRLKGVKNIISALIRTKNSVPYETPDNHPVKIVLALIVPKEATEAHLQTLANISQMFSNQKFRENLICLQSPISAQQMITNWKFNAETPNK